MALRWRIRHKLMLGFGVVVSIMGLLLAGTLLGLASYMATMKTIDSKLVELPLAHTLQEAIKALQFRDRPIVEEPSDSPGKEPGLGAPVDEAGELLGKMNRASDALKDYKLRLAETIKRHRDPDQGDQEMGVVRALENRFAAFERAVRRENEEPKAGLSAGSVALLDRPRVAAAIADLVRTADELQDAINDDLFNRIAIARGHYRRSLWVVVTTSIASLVFLAGLLRFFYLWVFHPIRDLRVGAGRVANGDFDHRIQVESGDEMEEVADAFNNMTERLQAMYRDLARQVNERSRQLVRSERLASVGFLAAGVAHEINNPLASIAFCSEALEARLATLGDEESPVVARYLKMIQEEAFRCKRITQKLLDFSRSGERKREPTDLGELVQSVLDVAQHLQNCKGKKIGMGNRPGWTGGRVVAWVNAEEIKSVILNLVVNALDSMEEGGKLTIRMGMEDEMAELEFSDTGCGMTDEVLENIFEPFFTRSRTGKGTGLGLTISHRVVTQHGGEIEASSRGTNQGSTFLVRLPLQPPLDQAEPAPEGMARLAA